MSVKSQLRLDPIRRGPAETFMGRYHEGGACQPATLYLGLFWDDVLHGVLAYGSPISNLASRTLELRSREVLELRRMIVDDVPERNTESRALAISARLIARHYSHVRVLLTYCREEEAAIAYRASGWHCIAVSRGFSTVELPSGEIMSDKNFRRRYGLDAHKTTAHTKLIRPTQKLALGLDDKIRSRIEALALA